MKRMLWEMNMKVEGKEGSDEDVRHATCFFMWAGKGWRVIFAGVLGVQDRQDHWDDQEQQEQQTHPLSPLSDPNILWPWLCCRDITTHENPCQLTLMSLPLNTSITVILWHPWKPTMSPFPLFFPFNILWRSLCVLNFFWPFGPNTPNPIDRNKQNIKISIGSNKPLPC